MLLYALLALLLLFDGYRLGSLTVRLAFVAWDATGGRWAANWRESAGGDDAVRRDVAE